MATSLDYDWSNFCRSYRLQNHDYASPGMYFITLCVNSREPLFGTIDNGCIRLNQAGRMIEKWWMKIPDKFLNVQVDAYIIMPEHFHAIVEITDPAAVDPCVNRVERKPIVKKEDGKGVIRGGHTGPPQRGPAATGLYQMDLTQPNYKPRCATVPGIVQWFKTMTTNKYIQGVKTGLFPPFDRRLWQRNYYDHIVRNEQALKRIREYIINNPAQREED